MNGRTAARVAYATCAELPAGDEDAPGVAAALAARGIGCEPAVWNDAAVDWERFDLVLVRSTWDYPPRRDAFLAWADALGDRIRNPPHVLRFSTDKRYLADLAAAGLPVVPTVFVAPGKPSAALPEREVVVKPAVSAGSLDTARHADPARAREHVAALLATGRTVMVQPYLPAVDTWGETALLYLDGRFSHAIRKGPLLSDGAATEGGLYLEEEIEPRCRRYASANWATR